MHDSIKYWLAVYPESVLCEWIAAKHRARLRRQSGPTRETLANRIIKKMTKDELLELQKELRNDKN